MSLSKSSPKDPREAMSIKEKGVKQVGDEPASCSGNRRFISEVPLLMVEDDGDSDWETVSEEDDGESDWETVSEEDALETADKNIQMGHDPYIKRTQEILCKEKLRAVACKGKKQKSGIWKVFSFGRGNKVTPLASILALKSDGENNGDQAIGSHQSGGKSDG